jgi:APA family basic amino acid/polyamine antiporter
VHPTRRVPHRAELVVAAVVIAVVLVADLRGAIGFSSFAVLFYYLVANASAFTLSVEERRWPRPLSVVGAVGCVVLALALPAASVVGGSVLLLAGGLVFAVRSRGRRGTEDSS